jgi:quinol-cytochrome oxidoreductase complex cytochrome b subunit|tara:strand:+ start:3202 stop:3426 length:225 start_codon:yes stop_codon:yes gene_type:complete
MDSVFKYLNGFLGGLFALLTALLPVTILFQVLTGTGVFGLDVISNLTSIIQTVGESGFAGLVAILFVCSFFIKK